VSNSQDPPSPPAPPVPLDAVNAGNVEFIEQQYAAWQRDKSSVDPQWAYFFAGFELAAKTPPISAAATAELAKPPGKVVQISHLIHSFREAGHLIANLDPLGHNLAHHPMLELAEFNIDQSNLAQVVTAEGFRGDLRLPVGELVQQLKQTYCGTFAIEFMDINDAEQRAWLIDRMEPALNRPALDAADRKFILERLIAVEEFEQFLQRRFPTVKRFSNEGGDALIPLLDALVERGAGLGMDELVIGMAHRGRLNVLVHILHKPYEMMMSEIIGRPAVKTPGDGDVKYHLGYATDHATRAGQRVHLSLVANPSHLEIIDPIVVGMARAKQNRKSDAARDRTIPLLIHGDAAFTGQGIVAETLYLSQLGVYRAGGTFHVIINNQVGFTTNPSDGRFTRYPTDIARAIQAPVFHVNGDDPEAVVHAARLAMEFRHQFKADVIVDLVCYRRRGHNETDDASVTQPVMAREIAAHPTVRQLYARRLIDAGVIDQAEHDRLTAEIKAKLDRAFEYAQTFKPSDNPPPVYGPWANFTKMPKGFDWGARTGVEKETLKSIARLVTQTPPDFHLHKTVARMMEHRLSAINEEKGIDWGGGEMLAFASLLNEGTRIRLTGQDVARGTFSHRNAIWFDNLTGRPFSPLAEAFQDRTHFVVVNSMLSEFAVLGFEYGFSSTDPHTLVIWEAQFGDFVNMAQPIIDQFISSGESKWGRYSGIVMLLPHGYEGQGPEHSHARLERFLQLCAEDNMQVCYPTTPAQLFHMLRRQVHRRYRRPLIAMSPKSMLRNPLCVSTLDEFVSDAGFQDWLDEADPLDKTRVRRVLLCSGKIYYELLEERRKQKINDVAIIRLEQIYPFNAERLTEISKAYPRDVEIAWVQEEPRNNGVYPFIGAKLHYHWVGMRKLYYVGRKPSASPAAGSHEQHLAEQRDIIARALGATVISRDVRDAKPLDNSAPRPLVVDAPSTALSNNVEVSASKDGK
jgi:2-oxoglutarate dehydrogenase E1 component